MASFYSNENIPRGLVEALRELGHDVLTSFDAGNANQRIPDDEVLRFSTGQSRLLLTFNRRHFKQLHRTTRGQHSGIVSCSPEANQTAQARKIHEILALVPGLAGKHLAIYLAHHSVE